MSRLLRLREALRRALRRAGWAGVAGGVLLALAVALDQHTAGEVAARRAELSAERARLLGGGAAQRPARAGIDRSSLETFYRGFPPRGELPALLAALQVQAERHGVDVDRSDYRIAQEPGAPLLRVVLALPVRAEYAALYGWVAELIAGMPNVGLDSLALRRADANSGFIEGELRLVVFVNAEGA